MGHYLLASISSPSPPPVLPPTPNQVHQERSTFRWLISPLWLTQNHSGLRDKIEIEMYMYEIEFSVRQSSCIASCYTNIPADWFFEFFNLLLITSFWLSKLLIKRLHVLCFKTAHIKIKQKQKEKKYIPSSYPWKCWLRIKTRCKNFLE